MFNSNLFGMAIFESLNCVELTGKQLSREEKRTWKERMFTLPWHPWKATKTVYYPEAIPAMYRIGNKIVGHPAKIAELKAEIDRLHAESPVDNELRGA
jgi:hypothetical protein